MDLTRHDLSRLSDTTIRQEGSLFGATHVTGGSLFQGNFVGLTINSTDSARPEYAGQFSHATLAPVKAFVERNILHDQIQTRFNNHGAHGGTKTLVVWGLGGAGKTQLVLDYVRRHRNEYRATFWLEAGRKESLERDFVHLYYTLFGLHASAGAGAATVSVEEAVTSVKSWFSGRQGPWLMVFDGADAIDDSEASDFINIKHFIPDVPSLHVIITSRSSTAAEMTAIKGVQVGEMEEAQAAELFHQYSQLPREVVEIADEVRAIAKELGHLALAVTLAATYVGSTLRLQSNIKAYLPEYRRRRRELLRQKPESLVHQYNESVLTTWETSYQAVAERCPEAAVLMTMLSFLSFDDIFPALFDANGRSRDSRGGEEADIESPEDDMAADEADTSWRHIVSPERSLDVYKIEECFAVLQRYSFVRWKADQQSYAMHELVHAWGHDRLDKEEQWKFSQAAFGLVVKAVNDCGSTPGEKLRMVPHVMANFAALTSASSGEGRVTEYLLYEMARLEIFISDLGRRGEAGMIGIFVLNRTTQLLGDEHPNTMTAMSNLAITLLEQGELDEAVKVAKEVIQIRRRRFGDEHPDTMTAMSNLAITLREQGELDEAAKMAKEVLQVRKRILGDEHLDTIMAMKNFAVALQYQNELDEAVKLIKEVLEKLRPIRGDQHPDTILAIGNLSDMLYKQGKLDEAAKIDKEVLESSRRILGDGHPDTIVAMYSLAVTLGDQGEIDEAAEMMKEVLEKQRRILGDEHPYTEDATHYLAHFAHLQKSRDRASLQGISLTRKRDKLKQLLRGKRRK